MNIKYLKTFLTAAETLNFTETAKRLGYVQSSITAQIKSIEDELQVELFQRLGKRLYLTKAGTKLQTHALKMLSLYKEMIYEVTDLSEKQIILTVGAQESQCTYRLPRILTQFRNDFPNIQVVFKPVHKREIANELLLNGKLDLAFITDTEKPLPMLKTIPLVEEDLVFVASPSSPITNKRNITIEDIVSETLLLTEQGCSYRTQLENTLQNHQLYLNHQIEFVSIEAIKQCVIAELGIAYLPRMVVSKELQNNKLVTFPFPTYTKPITTQLAWHKDKILPLYLLNFINLTKEFFLEDYI